MIKLKHMVAYRPNYNDLSEFLVGICKMYADCSKMIAFIKLWLSNELEGGIDRTSKS